MLKQLCHPPEHLQGLSVMGPNPATNKCVLLWDLRVSSSCILMAGLDETQSASSPSHPQILLFTGGKSGRKPDVAPAHGLL